jgi:GTP-dependent phosphoenolpyruvate carboxykinase
MDRALREGSVGCFCTQNCWDTVHGRYMYDIFRERGNLVRVFTPRDTELTPLTNHIEFAKEELTGLNAVVVEIQDVGARYFNYTKDVFRLMDALKEMLSVDKKLWAEEAEGIEEFYDSLGSTVPAELKDQLAKLKAAVAE